MQLFQAASVAHRHLHFGHDNSMPDFVFVLIGIDREFAGVGYNDAPTATND
jgi:hypothetical protein